MTTGDEAKARELLANAKALLLDFDGPVCSVFAGLPASAVAEQLRVVLADGGHADLPESVANADDPFDVFRYAATLGDDEARYVEAAFAALEVEAVASAEPTPGAHELIRAWRHTGRPLAIVSNNGEAAICTYLNLYGISGLVNLVSCRRCPDPALLKPAPYLVEQVNFENFKNEDFLLIGDSVADIEAARLAKINVIGLINKPGKLATLQRAGSAANVDSMSTFLSSGLIAKIRDCR